MEETLWQSIERLAPLAPTFVSVTYGAGGSTRERTHATVARILEETTLRPAAHLTCVAATRDEVDAVVRDYAGDAACATSWRCAAIPKAGSEPPTCPIPAATLTRAELVAGIAQARRFRDLGRRPTREAPGKPQHCGDRHRHAEAQGRRRRRPGDHPVLLRQRSLRGLCRAGAGGRHRYPDRSRHRAGPQLRPDRALRRRLRRLGAGLARAALRGARRRSRRPGSWSPPRSPPSRCSTLSTAASPTSTSTP